MTLALPYTRSVLTNGSLWFWGVVFMAFWFVLGAYVFSGGLHPDPASVLAYTSAWYAVIALFSLTTLSMAIASTIIYGTSALSFGFRFTRLSPVSYSLSLATAAALMGTLLSLVMALCVGVLFSAHFGVSMPPANVAGIVGVSLLTGAFMMGLAVVLVLVVVNYLGLRNLSFVEFVPLILAYIFGFTQLFLSLPAWVLYLSPWNDIQSLLYQAYSGSQATVILGNPTSAALFWPASVGALAAWALALIGVSGFLLRRIRSVSIEEGRQV